MMKGIARAARYILLALGVTFGVGMGFVVVPTFFGYESVIVIGDSMGSEMPMGSIALTRLTKVSEIEVGDVVSFRTANRTAPTTHRVVAIDHEEGRLVLTTKGDANAKADPEPLVLDKGSIPRVSFMIPFIGRMVPSARGPAGAMLLLVLPTLGLIFDRGDARRTGPATAPPEKQAPRSPMTAPPPPPSPPAPPAVVLRSSSEVALT